MLVFKYTRKNDYSLWVKKILLLKLHKPFKKHLDYLKEMSQRRKEGCFFSNYENLTLWRNCFYRIVKKGKKRAKAEVVL